MSFKSFLKYLTHGAPSSTKASAPVSGSVKVYVEDTESRVNGNNFETYCQIRNDSIVEILLDKVRVAGVKRETDTTLRAGERKQITVYSGPLFKNTAAHDAELQYKLPDGTYFIARHDVSYQRVDSLHSIAQLRYENTSQL